MHSQINYFAIDAKLIVSRAACRFYRLCAWISLVLLAWVMAGVFSPGGPLWLGTVSQLFLMLGALAYGALIVGMEIFLFRFDECGAVQQVLCFLLMLIPLLGAAIYCLLVYSRSQCVKGDQTRAASA